MALVFIDSFDHYASADILTKWTGVGLAGPSIQPTAGRRAGGALQLAGNGGVTKLGLPTTGGTAIIGAALRFTTAYGGGQHVFGIYSGGTIQVGLFITNGGALEIRRTNSFGPVLGSYAGPVIINQTNFYELKVVIHSTLGSVLLRINEVPVIDPGVPQNTSQTGAAAWDGLLIQGPQGINGSIFVDDLYCLDGSGPAPTNDLIGDCRVDARFALDEGLHKGWSPSAGGNRALMIDDTPGPDGDGTFNATATINAMDTFEMQDVAVPGAAFYGVQVVRSQKKSDAGTCSIAPVVRCADGASVVDDRIGPTVAPGTNYTWAITPYSLNPGTGLPWTEAEFNAAEFGYVRTA